MRKPSIGERKIGKISFRRRFSTHGGMYGRNRYSAGHGVETGVLINFTTGFQMKRFSETCVQYTKYFLDDCFHIINVLGTGARYLLDAGFPINVFGNRRPVFRGCRFPN